MSDVLSLRKEITALDKGDRFDPYSKIIINVTDDLFYEAGDDTGRTLTLSCPWGTQEMADNLLVQMRGFSYQPYKAEGAIMNPAAELGDAINVDGVYSGIYRMETTFDSHCSSNVSAPFDEEINYEYPYESKQEREVKRKNSEFSSQLSIHADKIKAEVEERTKQDESLKSEIKATSEAIQLEVSKQQKEITDGLANDIAKQGEDIADEASKREEQYQELKGALSIQADDIKAEVEARTKAMESLKGEFDIQAKEISAKVSKSGGDSSSFGWTLDESSWTLKSNGSTVLKATKDGIEIKGKITATSGKIGGFTINSNYISYNNQTWKGTNSKGIYIGISGIQLGTKFRVDSAGNLTAASGTFSGTVSAGKIKYGDDHGRLNGSALKDLSIGGGKIAEYTLSTKRFTEGVRTSLGRADHAQKVFDGINTAKKLFATEIKSTGKLSCETLYIYGSSVSKKSMSFKDGNGVSKYIYYWGWA